jgi:SAM-dependent methyltransferase
MKDQRRMYGDLAQLWPIISPPEDYVNEADLFAKLIALRSNIKAKTLLHLGCGAGHLDWTLKKHFRITGVDLSRQMLTLARRLNPEVEYRQGDMRTVRLRVTFDAVIIADSITYMTSERDLRKAFATAWTHLRPGGVFCSYAEQTKERFKQNKTEYSLRTKGDVEIIFIENDYDPDPTDTTCEFTFIYLIRQAGRLRIETDRHIGGLFNRETWLRILKGVGFDVAHKADPDEGFPLFICVKPQKFE